MQIIRDTSAINPETQCSYHRFFDGVHAGHRYLIQQVKEIAAAKGLRSALVTFPVHPRKVMNTKLSSGTSDYPGRKNKAAGKHRVDYCLMLDFTPEIFPAYCPRVHDAAVKRTLPGKIPGYRL
jgi:riboflavin kinase/FMN adenylyltransferase